VVPVKFKTLIKFLAVSALETVSVTPSWAPFAAAFFFERRFGQIKFENFQNFLHHEKAWFF